MATVARNIWHLLFGHRSKFRSFGRGEKRGTEKGRRGDAEKGKEYKPRVPASSRPRVSPSQISAPSAYSAVNRLKLGFEAIQEFLALLHGNPGPQSPVLDHPTAKQISAERKSDEPFRKGCLARLTEEEVSQEIEASDLNPGGGDPGIEHPQEQTSRLESMRHSPHDP